MFKKNVYEEYNKLIVNNIKLPLEDNEVPQGICRVNNTILVSCYMDNHEQSRVLMLDLDGSRTKTIILNNKAHVGGISYDQKHNLIFICDTKGKISSYPYHEFINENYIHQKKYDVSSNSLGGDLLIEDGNLVCSYLTCYDQKLYVGSFNKTKNGLIKVYDILRKEEGITLKYLYEFKVPRKSKELNTIAIVTHGGVYRSIYKNILRVDKKLEQIDDLAITELKYNNGKFEIINKQGIVFGETI